MQLSAVLVVAGTIIFQSTACSSATHPWSATSATDVFKDRTGDVTETDLYDRLPMVLARHGFFIVDSNRHDYGVTFETQWQERIPFGEEQVRGAVAARTRLRLNARRNGRMYSVWFEAENMIETAQKNWISLPFYEESYAYVSDIASSLRLEVASGVRRF